MITLEILAVGSPAVNTLIGNIPAQYALGVRLTNGFSNPIMITKIYLLRVSKYLPFLFAKEIHLIDVRVTIQPGNNYIFEFEDLDDTSLKYKIKFVDHSGNSYITRKIY